MANRVTFFANFVPNYFRINRLCGVTNFCTNVANESVESSEEDEVEFRRNVSRLTRRQRAKLDEHAQFLPPREAWEFGVRHQRKMYAKFGKASGVDPGVMWPTKAELSEIIEDEQECQPTLQELFERMEMEKAEKQSELQKRQEMIEKNMAKMPALVEQYEAKLQKKADNLKRAEERKKLLLEEAKEFFGYEINMKDPKFKQLQELKEKEAKKLAKQKKKEDKLRRLTASLTAEGVAQKS